MIAALAEGGADWGRWRDALELEGIDGAWLLFGLCAQALILFCIVVHVGASRKRRRFTIPPLLGYVGLIATVMLLVYAAQRHDLVFTVGQFLNTLLCLRLLILIRRARGKIIADEGPMLPKVAPDSAERKLPIPRE